MRKIVLALVLTLVLILTAGKNEVYGVASGECKECGCNCAFVSPGDYCADVDCGLSCGVVDGECVRLDSEIEMCPDNMEYNDSTGSCECVTNYTDCDSDLENGCETEGTSCDICQNNMIRKDNGQCVCRSPKGDFNDDGEVNSNDLIQWYLNYKSNVDYKEKERADFNCDGTISVLDLMAWYVSYRNPVPGRQSPTPTVTVVATPTGSCRGFEQVCMSGNTIWECCSGLVCDSSIRKCMYIPSPTPTATKTPTPTATRTPTPTVTPVSQCKTLGEICNDGQNTYTCCQGFQCMQGSNDLWTCVSTSAVTPPAP